MNLLKQSRRLIYLMLIILLLMGFLSSWAYDDPFITYRYAQNLSTGLGFVYNPDERVLSTTTPLFVLLLAPIASLGVDIHWLANFIGAISIAVGGLLLWDLAKIWHTPWVGWAGLLLYPTFTLVLTTMSSETPLYLTLCIAAFAAYARRHYQLTALSCALATLARPDGILVAVILALHLVVTHRGNLRTLTRSDITTSIGIFSGLLLAWTIPAWLYFGSPIPVTLAVKQGQAMMAISQKFAAGLLTVLQYYQSWPYLLEAAIACIGLLVLLMYKRTWLLFIAWTAIYFTAYSLLGVSRYFWYYAPLVPGFIVLIGLGLQGIADIRLRGAGFRLKDINWIRDIQFSTLNPSVMIAVFLLLVLITAQTQSLWLMSNNLDQRYAIYRAAGEWLAEDTPREARVGMLEVGVIGYFAKRQVVDFGGLIQPEVAQQMRANTTYEDTALWSVDRYQPQYVVLFPGSLPRFEQRYVMANCQPIHTFSAVEYEGPSDLVVYECNSGLQ